MGLDMSIYRESCVDNEVYNEKTDTWVPKKMVLKTEWEEDGIKVRENLYFKGQLYIREEVVGWRKAFAVHDWLLKHTDADGGIELDSLLELWQICKRLRQQLVWEGKKLKNPELADAMLPANERAYDSWYRDYVNYTYKMLAELSHDIWAQHYAYYYEWSW